MKRYRLVLLTLAVVAAALLLAACNTDDISALPEAQPADVTQLTGIQGNVPIATVLGLRWKPCFADTYADAGTPLADILTGCPGAQLMLACRPVGDPNLTLLSHAPRSVVTADTGAANNSLSTPYNGVGWYFNASWSWGFFVDGDGVSKSSCDTAGGVFPDLRMCWHAGDFVGGGDYINYGYRCGNNFLNNDPTWQRLVFTSG